MSRPDALEKMPNVLNDARLQEVADHLTAVPGITGVVLGGSRARGDHTPESDYDLGLYYRPPLDVDALRDLARRLTGTNTAVTEPGAWGPWVNGGAWLTIDGSAVDLLYRDVERVHASCAEAIAGRYDFAFQVGHPLGVPSFAYAGELALGQLLADPSGELAALQRQVQNYPPALRTAVVDRLWEADFSIDNAHKAVRRQDSTFVAGCLFRAVELCAHAVHAHAGRWLINEKGAVAAAGHLPAAPPDFAARAQALMAHLGDDSGHLTRSLEAASALLSDVRMVCSDSPRAGAP